MNIRRCLAVGAVLAVLGACDAMDQPTDPIPVAPPALARVPAPVCHTISFDDLGLGHGSQVTSIPTPLGFSLDVAVTPTGAHSAPSAVLYSTDNMGGPDFDLEWNGASARCPDCEGLGNILVIEDSRGFAPEGDSDTGGTISLTGFPASGVAFIERYAAVDQESTETAIQLYVDGGLIGGSSGQGDGSVETVLASSPAITEKAEFVLGGSGGMDNLKVCTGEPGLGRMTGGGNQITLDDVRVSRGFTIHCDITLSNNLEINWPDNKWHIEKPLTRATCLDDPAVDPAPPVAPFDTFIGEGIGRLNGVDGSVVRFTFVDSGEPGGRNDSAEIKVWAPGADPDVDAPVLEVSGLLDNGNLQAHYDQPHGSNWNR
jgi:hypothetical protein